MSMETTAMHVLKARLADDEAATVLAEALAGVVISGAFGGQITGSSPANYRFVRSVPTLHDGSYEQLGSDGGLIYLRSCSKGNAIIAVASSSIEEVTEGGIGKQATLGPDLWQILHGQPAKIGLRACHLFATKA